MLHEHTHSGDHTPHDCHKQVHDQTNRVFSRAVLFLAYRACARKWPKFRNRYPKYIVFIDQLSTSRYPIQRKHRALTEHVTPGTNTHTHMRHSGCLLFTQLYLCCVSQSTSSLSYTRRLFFSQTEFVFQRCAVSLSFHSLSPSQTLTLSSFLGSISQKHVRIHHEIKRNNPKWTTINACSCRNTLHNKSVLFIFL